VLHEIAQVAQYVSTMGMLAWFLLCSLFCVIVYSLFCFYNRLSKHPSDTPRFDCPKITGDILRKDRNLRRLIMKLSYLSKPTFSSTMSSRHRLRTLLLIRQRVKDLLPHISSEELRKICKRLEFFAGLIAIKQSSESREK
jgi:hypothetical protein